MEYILFLWSLVMQHAFDAYTSIYSASQKAPSGLAWESGNQAGEEIIYLWPNWIISFRGNRIVGR